MNCGSKNQQYRKVSGMERTHCSVRVQRGNPLHYLRLYFNCCYYMCIIPYRFVLDETTAKYKLKTSPVQRAFCFIIWSLCCCEESISLRDTIEEIRNPEKGQDDPLAYFNMLYTCSNLVYYGTVINTVWWKSRQFLALIQCLHENRSDYSHYERNQRINTKAILCVSLTLIPFLIYPTTFVASFFMKRSTWSWIEIFDFWSLHASRALFLEALHPNFNLSLKILFSVFRNLFLLGYTQLTTAMEMLIFNCAMLLFDSVQDFSEIVKDKTKYPCSQVLKEYDMLRVLARNLNKAVGFLTFGLTLACLPYYVVNLLEFIKPVDVAVFIRQLMFFSANFGFLILAAHINKKAHMLEEWLIAGRNYEELSPTALNILLHDLSGRNIGFNGSGFFKITPAFLGTIISLLLTFSIIMIQFKTSTPVTPSTSAGIL